MTETKLPANATDTVSSPQLENQISKPAAEGSERPVLSPDWGWDSPRPAVGAKHQSGLADDADRLSGTEGSLAYSAEPNSVICSCGQMCGDSGACRA